MGPAIDLKRQQLDAMGVDSSGKVGILFDRFSGNFSEVEEPLRQRWAAEHNAIFVEKDDVPAGLSKHLQPCDKIHAYWRVFLHDATVSISTEIGVKGHRPLFWKQHIHTTI